MPAALDVDWEQVRTLAVAVGLKVAAERLGLPYDAVRQRSCREDWLTSVPRNQALPPTVRQPVTLVTSPAKALADELSALGGKSRLSVARGLAKASAHIETMDGQEIVEDAANVKQTVQSLAVVHGWAANAPVTKIALHLTGGHSVTVEEGTTMEAEWCDGDDVQQVPKP